MARGLVAVLAVAVLIAIVTARPPHVQTPAPEAAAEPSVAGATAAVPVAHSERRDAPAPARGSGLDDPGAAARSRPLLRGVILDNAGRAVAGARVQTADGATATSDAAGWFALTAPASAGPVAELLFSARGYAPQARQARWGAASQRVEMQVSGLFAVDVVDASSGRPIERYEVQLLSASEREPRAAPVFLRGRHAGGHLEARVDVSSPAMLRVVPADEGFAPSAPALVALDPIRPGAVRVELRRWTELVVAVEDERGAPVVGARVEVLAPPPGAAVTLETVVASSWMDHRVDRASLLSTATTSPAGAATLRVPAGGGFDLRVEHVTAGAAVSREPRRSSPLAMVRVQLRR
ncbi:MAG: carboxypeptidase-like regulatory domain-containing protein [Planctomycetota bacterium]|nr:carboxypeptidase-like regulatory domain-containing protein [Planctomycetota bacterium]MEC9046925.1 carboxypeptidase-like regulatory domain-containing protein [Planctomycetota bacterium]